MMKRRAQGGSVSAIELMVVLAITAVLSTVALPSYREQVVRLRRAEAKAVLLSLMQQQERYASRHNTFIAFSADSTDADARQFRWWSGKDAPASAYEIEGKACDGEQISACIQLLAKPGTYRVDPQFKDPECGQLTLTSTGDRQALGPARRCWQ
jgi:type IV pilus assembly protein PilE